MSRSQFGFLIGFLIAGAWAAFGFLVALGMVVAGLVGFGVGRVLEGRVDLGEMVDRLRAGSAGSRR